ncbi:hypothetical protein [Pseudomonas sp. CFBP 13719]|nr:hypothetical protein [Pseudomonas sp. CFBP 13719]
MGDVVVGQALRAYNALQCIDALGVDQELLLLRPRPHTITL